MEQTHESSLYRVDFSCAHVGRHVARTKRQVTWRYSSNDLVEGERPCLSGQAQEVRLVWSVLSGKSSLIWNNKKICQAIGERRLSRRRRLYNGSPVHVVEFFWKDDKDRRLKVVAHSEAIPEVTNQYELLFEDESFFSLPSVLQTGSTRALSLLAMEQINAQSSNRSISFKMRDMTASAPAAKQNPEPNEFETEREDAGRAASMPAVVLELHTNSHQDSDVHSLLSDSNSSLINDVREDNMADVRGQQQSHRLSAIGLELDLSNHEILVPRDELHSPCSSQLEQLREEVSQSLPAAEDMMSQAIIFAFSHEERGHENPLECDGRSESFDLAYMVDVIWETLDFIKSQDDQWHCYDRTEQNSAFMQRQINNIVSHVRRNEISKVAAKHAIFCMAILLDLEQASSLDTTIVTLFGLKRKTVPTDVREALEMYGEIEGIALSRKCPGFGICHFSSANAAKDAVRASQSDGVQISNTCARIMDLPAAGETERTRQKPKRESFSPASSASEDEDVDPAHFHPGFASPQREYSMRRIPNSFPKVENGTEVDLQEFESYVSRPRIGRPKMYKESQKSSATVSTEACSMTDSETYLGSSYQTLSGL